MCYKHTKCNTHAITTKIISENMFLANIIYSCNFVMTTPSYISFLMTSMTINT